MGTPFIDVLVCLALPPTYQKATTNEGNDEDLGGTNGAAELPFHQPRTLREQRSRKRRKETPNKVRFCSLFPPFFLQPLGSPGTTFFRERRGRAGEGEEE